MLNHYGGMPPQCACCHEKHPEFLVIDHINGKGNVHRRRHHLTSGDTFYAWLRKNNYPEGFRILCDNCNMSFGRYGYCPHKRKGVLDESVNNPVSPRKRGASHA